MFRRNFLKTLSLGGIAGFLTGSRAQVQSSSGSYTVGSVNLSDMEIIDVHVHQHDRMTLTEYQDRWNGSFVDALTPVYDYPGKDALRARLAVTFKKQIELMPRQTGIQNYCARVYGVEPSIEGVNSVQTRHKGGDYTAYIRAIMDREKITGILLQSRGKEPVRPKALVPNDRFRWSYSIGDLIEPGWAKGKGAQQIGDVTEAIDGVLETCKSNGCAGLKIPIAYYRPLSVEKVEKAQAEQDLRALFTNEPTAYVPGRTVPLYKDPELARALRSYQDFLLKHIYVKAGELGLVIIIHSAVALHPALRFDWNSPLGLYHVFQDDDIKRVETKFVIIHSGYPYHHHVAALLSEFPNVYTDVSFYCNFPGVLEELLRTFLGLAPSEKLMHGSDSDTVPEIMGYCAETMRRVMAKVLNDYRSHYGWTERDCEKMARNVFAENAKRVYGIET